MRGGPVTVAGKAISRLNATKHGALSEVIPDHEVASYTQHLELIHQHYQPVGYLEELLSERVANLLWRLGRVARYEQATVTRHVENAFRRDGNFSLDDVIKDLEKLAQSAGPSADEAVHEMRVYLQQTVALASLPADLVEKVPRYEAHLDRALKRAMDQLAELQNARR